MPAREVSLRPIEREDLAYLRDLANEPAVRQNVVGWDWPLSLAGQQSWFDRGIDTATTRRLIVEDEKHMPIGLTGLWEIDWRNRNAMTALKLGGRPDIRGRGYGTAAVAALMQFAFDDVGLHRLHSTIIATNAASRALYVGKCGWSEEGLLRQHVWRNGDFQDVVQVGILRDEYDTWLEALNAQ